LSSLWWMEGCAIKQQCPVSGKSYCENPGAAANFSHTQTQRKLASNRLDGSQQRIPVRLKYGVILDMTRVQMRGKLHCEVIMCWNPIVALANPFSHSRRPATLLVQPLPSSSHHSYRLSSCPPIATHGFYP
jgi:hypothetical protein